MISREMEIAVLQDAVKILKRIARRDKCQETQEAVNVIEVVIGDLQDLAEKARNLMA